MRVPWQKSNDKPRQHIEKQRHYFAYKVCVVKAVVFPVVMYGCESWDNKKGLELMPSNCGAGEDSSESFGQRDDHTSQS